MEKKNSIKNSLIAKLKNYIIREFGHTFDIVGKLFNE
jgi:hypothetical protein